MQKNIEYLITSEFHVDKGPSIIEQYPENIPGSENLQFLPELTIPDQIHKRDEDYTLFLLYRNTSTGHYQYVYDKRTCEKSPYFLYTLVNNVKDMSVKRNSVIKSLSLLTKLPYFKSFKPLLLICLDKYYKSNNTYWLQELYQSVNSKNFDLNSSISVVKRLLITSILDLPINAKIYGDEAFRSKLLGIKDIHANEDLFLRKDLSYNSIISFNNMNIPVKIPMINLPDCVGDYFNPTDLDFKPNLINILNAKLATELFNDELTIYGLQTPPIILLINALLTGKKIIFMSYENPSGYIIDHVLLALKIITGGGILSGFLTSYNFFPMIDVSKIDILEQCHSYIAGTINPFFRHNDKLWDVLYDLDANEIYLSTQIATGKDHNVAYRNSIISEDAKFISNLQLSLFTYNDDLTTIQLIFRRHINEIIRILLSSKNFNNSLLPNNKEYMLLMDGIGYFWNNDANKLVEITCYQFISNRFQDLLYQGVVEYHLLLPQLANELSLMIDLQYHLQSINNLVVSGTNKINEREIWFNILKYLISGKSLETLLLITYLIPPSSSSSMQSSSVHGGSLTIFDKNKGIELLLMNLFNKDDQIKTNVITILQELKDNFLCGWCLNSYIRSNMIYELAFNELCRRND